MMTATSRRSTALALAAAFAFMLAGEAAGAHPCPHHDGLPGGATAAESAAQAAGTEAAHAAGSGAASHRAHHAPTEGDGAHRACSCVGVCQLGSGAATPAAAAKIADPSAGVLERPTAPVPAFFRQADRLLPFAHAPPAAF
jgi:hypothetical protein